MCLSIERPMIFATNGSTRFTVGWTYGRAASRVRGLPYSRARAYSRFVPRTYRTDFPRFSSMYANPSDCGAAAPIHFGGSMVHERSSAPVFHAGGSPGADAMCHPRARRFRPFFRPLATRYLRPLPRLKSVLRSCFCISTATRVMPVTTPSRIVSDTNFGEPPRHVKLTATPPARPRRTRSRYGSGAPPRPCRRGTPDSRRPSRATS